MDVTIAHIDQTLPKIQVGLEKYLWLQEQVRNRAGFHLDPQFRRRFNGFYRVRINREWQQQLYALMARVYRDGGGFQYVLRMLYEATGRLGHLPQR